MPLPHPFRLVYRAFDRIDFDPRKSDEIFVHRGFDMAYVARIFPGTVLEREDTRPYAEKDIRHWENCSEMCSSWCISVRADTAALSRPGRPNHMTASDGMNLHIEPETRSERPLGRIDRSRFGQRHPDDREQRPVITQAAWDATKLAVFQPR